MLEIWLDRLILLVEIGEIGNNIFDDVGVGKRVDLGLVLGICWNAAYIIVKSQS